MKIPSTIVINMILNVCNQQKQNKHSPLYCHVILTKQTKNNKFLQLTIDRTCRMKYNKNVMDRH